MFPPKLIATVTVGERGQIVVPTEARNSLNIKPGEKLLVFLAPGNNALLVTKPDAFENMAKKFQQHITDSLEQQKNITEEI